MNPKRRPLKVDWALIDLIEKELIKTLKAHLYNPLIRLFKEIGLLKNAKDEALHDALRSGKIKYWDNKFTGRFSAGISKELKALGAQWRPRSASFYLPLNKLPKETQDLLFGLNREMVEKLMEVDGILSMIDPEKVADSFKAKNLFVKAIKSSEDDVESVSKKISIRPNKETMEAVAQDWFYGINAEIKKWTTEEVINFRKEISGLIYQGKRFGTKERPGELEREVLLRYGAKIRDTIAPGKQFKELTEKQKERIINKARFIARNDSRLLMTTYKYTRMQSSGSTFFRWLTVVGSPKHPVRPSHKILNRKVWRWDHPPIDEQNGKPVLPGQAYNCRCTAVPLYDEDIAKDKKGDFKQYPDGSYVLK